jgi:hypothetical protein
MAFKIKISLYFFSVFLLGSCYPFRPMKNPPTADVCYFDPKDLTIRYTGAEAGIVKIHINVVTSETSYISNYFMAEYKAPITTIDLSKMDTAILKKGFIMVDIWDKLPTMENGYWIFIKPPDWQKTKLVYSRYNMKL